MAITTERKVHLLDYALRQIQESGWPFTVKHPLSDEFTSEETLWVQHTVELAIDAALETVKALDNTTI